MEYFSAKAAATIGKNNNNEKNNKDNFNPFISSSKYRATLEKTSATVGNGHCFFDAVFQAVVGLQRNEDIIDYLDLRRRAAEWARENPEIMITEDMNQLQYLQVHIGCSQLDLSSYQEWWSNVISSNCYAETPAMVAVSILVGCKLFVWQRRSSASKEILLACVTEAQFYQQDHQIHLLLDTWYAEDKVQIAHFTLVQEYIFKVKGASYSSNTPPRDFRLSVTQLVNSTQVDDTSSIVNSTQVDDEHSLDSVHSSSHHRTQPSQDAVPRESANNDTSYAVGYIEGRRMRSETSKRNRGKVLKSSLKVGRSYYCAIGGNGM